MAVRALDGADPLGHRLAFTASVGGGFGGAKGTAEEMYRGEAPEIVAGKSRAEADAKTFAQGDEPIRVADIQRIKLQDEAAGQFYYHTTNIENLHDIAETGKLKTFRPDYGTDQAAWPDGSTQKRAYFLESPEHIAQFSPEGRSVVVRIPREAGAFKRERTGDIYSEKPVNTSRAEYLAEDGTWKPLKPGTFYQSDRAAEVKWNQ